MKTDKYIELELVSEYNMQYHHRVAPTDLMSYRVYSMIHRYRITYDVELWIYRHANGICANVYCIVDFFSLTMSEFLFLLPLGKALPTYCVILYRAHYQLYFKTMGIPPFFMSHKILYKLKIQPLSVCLPL